MALIKCPECGKEVSENASKCPNCGCKLKNNRRTAIIIILVLVLTCVGSYGLYKYEQNINQLSPGMQEWSDEFDKKMERSKKNNEEIRKDIDEIESELEFMKEAYD